MSDPAAILGDYADFKIVRTRKVCQVIIEVPIERADEVAQRLGFPSPGGNKPCAVALIQVAGLTASKAGDGPHREDGRSLSGESAQSPPTKPKRRWQDMPPSQRAALLTKDGHFWAYLESQGFLGTELAADGFIKRHCGIQSKGELKPGNNVENLRFEDLEGNFKAWSQARGHGVI